MRLSEYYHLFLFFAGHIKSALSDAFYCIKKYVLCDLFPWAALTDPCPPCLDRMLAEYYTKKVNLMPSWRIGV